MIKTIDSYYIYQPDAFFFFLHIITPFFYWTVRHPSIKEEFVNESISHPKPIIVINKKMLKRYLLSIPIKIYRFF